MTEQEIIKTVTAFGFIADSNNSNVYFKEYSKIKYQMSIDFEQKRIDFGAEIKKGDATTSHLESSENIVVLECVDRLLEKGYKPTDLTLEKRWKLGRTTKSGKADITVRGKNGKTLIIIECKTWGKEYEKELEHMKANGGQLFSYYQQDKNTRYLCLYTSREQNNKIEKTNALIKVEDTRDEKIKQQETEKLITYQQAKTIKEMLEVWKHKTKGKQTFLNTGLFEPEIEPYNPGYIPLKIADLKDFGKEDKGKVFNQFEEILRHNNISDRSNAFNRIISLILAKIVDENKREDAITDFQIKEGIDDPETLLERLQSLYSKAMRDYLDEEVIDYKLEDIEAQIAHFPRQTAKETLYRIYKELKFYQNNEFAFKEVYNKKLFEENAKVLEEVVRLFQPYRFKYDQKAQFLGDFFELMLESGYKQSEGQFFTPTPIARFIIVSIPLQSIVQEKLKQGERLFLPKVIDFACGSGHFLTEAIEAIANLIKEISETDIKNLPDLDQIDFALNELDNYKKSMRWANDYIFGIEKDYRLARTSQVACFMHGDGDANIIFGDGLEKHPCRLAPKNKSGDGTFDVLIANPPYTIKDFKKHLKVHPHDFEMWNYVTPDSDDIEVFFIERMKQLLRVGGMAGIVLPSSILSNTGAYTKAREIILKHFEIKAIVEFGGNTFGATSTNTVTLFLKKRSEDFVTNCQYIAEDLILENKEREGDFINSKELFENYIAHLELDIKDYTTFLARKPNDTFQETEFYKTYKTWFNNLTEIKQLKKKKSFKNLNQDEQIAKLHILFFDWVLELEKEKFFFFLLTHRIKEEPEHFAWYNEQAEDGRPLKVVYPQQKAIPQKTLIVKTGRTTKEQQKFLGYKFSNRRGYKGIDFTGDTLMFDQTNLLHPQKVNTYIQKNFIDEKFTIDTTLNEHLSLVQLTDCIDFEKIDFDKRISTSVKHKFFIESNYPVIKFAKHITINPPKEIKGLTDETKVAFIEMAAVSNDGYVERVETKALGEVKSGYTSFQAGDIIFAKITPCMENGKCAFLAQLPHRLGFGSTEFFVFRTDTAHFLPKFVFYFINREVIRKIAEKNMTGTSGHRRVPTTFFSTLMIPKPPLDIQQKIIDEIEAIEARETRAKEAIELKKKEIDRIFMAPNQNAYKDVLGNICTLKAGQFVKAKAIRDTYQEGLYPCYGGNGLRGYTTTYTHEGTFPLVGRQGALCGNVHIITGKFHATEHALVVTPKGEVNVIWLYHLLRLMNLNQYARGVAQPGLSVKYLNPILVTVLPIEEQRKMVKEIEKFEAEITKAEKSIVDTEEEKKAILTKYLEK